METIKPGDKYPEQGVQQARSAGKPNGLKAQFWASSPACPAQEVHRPSWHQWPKEGQAQVAEQWHQAGVPWASCGALVASVASAAQFAWVSWEWLPTAQIKINVGRFMQVLWILGQHSFMPVTLMPWKAHPCGLPLWEDALGTKEAAVGKSNCSI